PRSPQPRRIPRDDRGGASGRSLAPGRCAPQPARLAPAGDARRRATSWLRHERLTNACHHPARTANRPTTRHRTREPPVTIAWPPVPPGPGTSALSPLMSAPAIRGPRRRDTVAVAAVVITVFDPVECRPRREQPCPSS